MVHLPASRSHLDEHPSRRSHRDIKILAGRKPVRGRETRTSMSQSRPCGVYLDPPYPHDTRTVTDAYEHEMTMDDHAALLELIRGVRGAVAISSYPSPFYERTLAG